MIQDVVRFEPNADETMDPLRHSWRAIATGDDGGYVGTVWNDGTVTFGPHREIRDFGSVYLAACALVLYVMGGGL